MRSRITSYKAVFGGLMLTAMLTGSWSVADLTGGGAVQTAALQQAPASYSAAPAVQDDLHAQLARLQARAAARAAQAAAAARAAQLQQAALQQASPAPAPTPAVTTPQPATPPPPADTPPPSPSPPPPSGTGQLAPDQVGAYWLAAGGPAWAEQASESVAMCESGDNTNAYNPSGASGLWQILGQVVPGNIFDPSVNAANAVSKFEASGDSWAQWTCQP